MIFEKYLTTNLPKTIENMIETNVFISTERRQLSVINKFYFNLEYIVKKISITLTILTKRTQPSVRLKALNI